MTETACVRCERPMPDQAYACSGCAYRAGDQLHTIADMTAAARDVAQGRARRGSSGSSSAESRLPLNLGATQRLDAVQAELTGWARHVAATRGIRAPRPETLADDPVAITALWLAGHVEWIRHRQEAEEFLADVAAAARIVSGIARGPAEQQYLGPCGASREHGGLCGHGAADPCFEDDFTDQCTCWCHKGESENCEGDIYAARGAKIGRCRTCRAEVATAEREAWLDGEVRGHAFRASEIANAYRVNVNTIRSWVARGQLKSYWRTQLGLTIEWIDPVLDDKLKGEQLKQRLGEISDEIQTRGGRLHYVGDVLDLAAADAARRATDQATRARRAAAKAAESEDAA